MAPKKAPSPEPQVADDEPQEEAVPEEWLKGDFVFPDGSTYKGQYLQKGTVKTIHGEGILQSGPEVFQGTFERGSYKKGTYTGCNGAVYSGTFKDNQFHGFGEYRWPDSRSYKGMWKDGKMHGRGKFSNFSFGADQTKEGFSVAGEFASSWAKQQDAKKRFMAEYGAEYLASATAALKDLTEAAAGSMDAIKQYLVPYTPEDEEEAPEDKEERTKVEELINGKFPTPEEILPATLQALVAGLELADGDEAPKTKVSVVESSAESVCMNSSRFKASGQWGVLASQQLQHVGQCVEFTTPGAEANAPRLVLANVSRDFDASQAAWKIVHYDEIPEPA